MPEKLKAKCGAAPPSPASPPSPAAAAAAPSPSTGKKCPQRKLMEKCNVNCNNAGPKCTGENSDNIFTFGNKNNNGVTTYVSVLIVFITIDRPKNHSRPIEKQ